MLRTTRILVAQRPVALASKALVYTETATPSKKLKNRGGKSHCFFCCSEDKENQQLNDTLFYVSRLRAMLAVNFNCSLEDKLIRANIPSIMVAKISSRGGDAELVFVGDKVASAFGFTHASQLLGRDLMDFFANPIFARKHKGFLKNFATFGGMQERSTEVLTFFYEQFPSFFNDDLKKKTTPWLNTILQYAATGVDEAPKDIRSFLMKGNNGLLLETRFRLITFYLNSNNLGAEERKYSGVYTIALFFSITNRTSLTKDFDTRSTDRPEVKR